MQAVITPGLHEPEPLQKLPAADWERSAEQVTIEHTFEADALAHVPVVASQVPVLPHPRGAPSAGQVLPQQILPPPLLATQAPLAQSVSAVQVLPFPMGWMQAPPEQTYPLAQVVAAFPAVQDVAHAVPEQRYPAPQFVVTIVGHAPPVPGQLAAAVIEVLEAQEAVRQTVLLENF
jgi:hypothetical protein